MPGYRPPVDLVPDLDLLTTDERGNEPKYCRWQPSEFNPEGHDFVAVKGLLPWRRYKICVSCGLKVRT